MTKRMILLFLLSVPVLGMAQSVCGDAMIRYAEQYPECEPQDLYKLVFQDFYGPGHIIRDSLSCAQYIHREVEEMDGETAFPIYEYTLCDSNYVRINLIVVKRGLLDERTLTSAVLRSVQPGQQPDMRFHMSHSVRFKKAYNPHYRIVKREIFERELLPLLNTR